MKPIILYSPYSCLVRCKNHEIEIDESEHAIIDDYDDRLDIYPTGKTKRYSFYLDLKEKDGKFYSIIEKNDKILVFLLDGYLSENVDIFNYKYNNIESSVEVSQSSLSFASKNHKKTIILSSSPQKVKCGNFYHIDYALLTYPNYQILFAYNAKTNQARQFSGEEITLSKNGFIVKSSQGGYSSVQEEYYVDSEGLKSKAKSFSLSNQALPDELIPYQLMTAIKNGDREQIESLLSDNLKAKLSIDNVIAYFGKVSYFYMIDARTAFAISNNDNILYEFTLSNGKITEIMDNK